MRNGVCRRRAFSVFVYRTVKKAVVQLGRYSAIVNNLVAKQRSNTKTPIHKTCGKNKIRVYEIS